MKAQRLTPAEKELFDSLHQTPGGVLRKHVRPTGTLCYRLLDDKMNPIKNYRQGLVDKLKDKDVLEMRGWDYVLKATTDNITPQSEGLASGLSYSTKY